MSTKFHFFKQLDAMDCGPSCLRMIAKYYGKSYSLQLLRARCFITNTGVSLQGISDAAESIGFRTIGVKISFTQLVKEVPLPCIVHWNQNHFVVVYKISKDSVFVADPAHGLVSYKTNEFLKSWISTRDEDQGRGIALAMETSPDFYQIEDEKTDKTKLSFFVKYIMPYRKYIWQLLLGMLVGTLLQLIFPFLTQAIVDTGISNRNLSFVTLILIAQLALMMGRVLVEFLRSWILLHISTRINISLISDFLIKLMKLPIAFFDSKKIGDIMQRIGDHSRIESFLTGSSLSTLFSLVNLVIFGAVLAYYSLSILTIFLIGNTFYIVWILLFMKRRRELDYKRFQQASDNQSNLFQLVTGMQEIKLNNCEKQKRWEWERIQAKLFRVSVKGLALGQWQHIGSLLFSQSTNILISFLSARLVIKGEMTLGMMMSVQYIVGQISVPIEQLIDFMQAFQDAKISLERLGEIHQQKEEEPQEYDRLTLLPEKHSIKIENLNFRYEGPHSPLVLDNITLSIPQGKITAIVGTSGSGKTTLVKLLLGFYAPVEGDIKIGEISLKNLNGKTWRQKCGAVMQDGFIFSESIAKNIAVAEEIIDNKKLLHAVKIANIQDFIESLPLSYNTKIGQEGSGISQGQKQRLLIARAVYKNPDFLFFDEATNALDANNERTIMENLNDFFRGKTVMIVAHRLSTVKNADQIIVLEKGKLVEQGTHKELTLLKGKYYELVKNQLELGN